MFSDRLCDGTAAGALGRLLQSELSNIPLEHWGFFFPCHVAVWRFIELERSGILGGLDAGFDVEPYFRGRGSEWFCDTLGNRDEYLCLLEAIMYPLVDSLPVSARERGFLLLDEVPPLDAPTIEALSEFVLSEADMAKNAEQIRP